MLEFRGKTIALDAEGYLVSLEDWSESVAELLAEKEAIELTDAHRDILRVIREFYAEFDLSPAMRPLVKYIGLKLGKDKASSLYLMQLFSSHQTQTQKKESPAKTIARLAGLPKPLNCI